MIENNNLNVLIEQTTAIFQEFTTFRIYEVIKNR